MKILIIEDEAFASRALQSLILKLKPDAQVLEKLESIEEAVEWFSSNPPPDLIFCDIHLSDGNSFEIFKRREIESPVIFTTAFDQYAIEAFKVNSIDYLLKPIVEKELAKALIKYEQLQGSHRSREYINLQNLLQNSLQERALGGKKSRFMVKAGQTIKTISSEDIALFLAEEGVVLLTTFEGRRYVVSYTLDQLEEMLDLKKFFRVNRQIIVNIEAVKEVNPYFKGRLQLVLTKDLAGEQIISSSKASAFKEWLDL